MFLIILFFSIITSKILFVSLNYFYLNFKIILQRLFNFLILFLASVNVTGECEAGYFCLSGSVSSKPFIDIQGGKCPIGSYCPKGSSTPKLCDKGNYCPDQGLKEPFDNCSSGYYCLLGAKTSQPNDNITGGICPKGAYCPSGSHIPILCPPGTYSNTMKNKVVSECLNCSAGFYCRGYGNNYPSGPCNAGYYCPGGQEIPNPAAFMCRIGFFCDQGSKNQTPCPSGSYQNEIMQASCKVI